MIDLHDWNDVANTEIPLNQEIFALWSDRHKCTPDCEYYHEIWDEKELQEELDKDEDKHLLDEPSED